MVLAPEATLLPVTGREKPPVKTSVSEFVEQLTKRPMPEIVRSATETSARIMGIADRKGAVEAGYDADIVIFDDEVNIQSTIVNGQIVYNI